MKKVALVAVVVGVGVAALTLTGFRHGFGHHRMTPEQITAFVTDHVDDTLDDLDATPAQRDRIHAVKDRLLADGLALRDGGQTMHQAFLDEWKAATPDKAKLHALVDARIEAFRKVAHEAVDAGVEVHDVLTPEQRAKITKKAERHMGEP